MAYSYLLTDGTDEEREIALVRREVDDRTDADSPIHGTHYFQEDDDIAAALATALKEAPSDANDVEVRLMACASILDTLATNQAFVLKVGQTLSDEFDGAKVADAIRKHADSLRKRAKDSWMDRRHQAELATARGQVMKKPASGVVKIRSVF